jgi:hypothetical protein
MCTSSPKRTKVDESDLAPTRTRTVVRAYADITKSVSLISQRTDANRIVQLREWQYFFSCTTRSTSSFYQVDFQDVIQTIQKWGIHTECDLPHRMGRFNPDCAVDMYLKACATMWSHGVCWSGFGELPDPPQSYWIPPPPSTVASPPVELPDDIWRTISLNYLDDVSDKRAIARASSRLVKLFLLPALVRSAQQISALVNRLNRDNEHDTPYRGVCE